jgi:hypothetical protein
VPNCVSNICGVTSFDCEAMSHVITTNELVTCNFRYKLGLKLGHPITTLI